MQYLGYSYTKNFFIAYLKFKFNWCSAFLFAKPITLIMRIS